MQPNPIQSQLHGIIPRPILDFILISIFVSILDMPNHPPRIALASRTIVHNLVRKNVAIDTEMLIAFFAGISSTLADALDSLIRFAILANVSLVFRDFRKRRKTGKASLGLGGIGPRNFDPVLQWKEMVI